MHMDMDRHKYAEKIFELRGNMDYFSLNVIQCALIFIKFKPFVI